jgi:hypothetical protein
MRGFQTALIKDALVIDVDVPVDYMCQSVNGFVGRKKEAGTISFVFFPPMQRSNTIGDERHQRNAVIPQASSEKSVTDWHSGIFVRILTDVHKRGTSAERMKFRTTLHPLAIFKEFIRQASSIFVPEL